ncbi:MAG: ABC transporter ATP-binding protein [Saprospiraceae bacterium]|nr:ABC transporter ATP-binding protein [Saprospiraceae bacterium]
MEKQKLLQVENLLVQFETENGRVTAVKNISFTLFRGETVGIVGESGSGKSVTSLSIMRLIAEPPGRIAGGKITYFTEGGAAVDLLALTEKEMEGYRGNELAMIFQEPMTSLNPVYTCGNQVMEAILTHQNVSKAEAEKQTIALFEKVKLPDPKRAFTSFPHQLSGGQKQRVMIAMAMSNNPSVLIADEPTTALDVTVQKTILELMKELQSEMNASIVFITHDLGVIAEIADRVLVMYKGEIVEQGDAMTLFKSPQHPYTKSLLACRPPLGERLRRLPVVSDFMEVEKQADGSNRIIEKSNSVGKVLAEVRIPQSEIDARLSALVQGEPILRVEHLKTYYPSKRNFWGKPVEFVKAVDDVSFEVYEGETLGLVGESGCGKTTLGRAILKLSPATEGSIFYKGQDLTKLNAVDMKALRKEIQIIFQDPYSSLNPRMTIGSAIIEPMQVHNLHNNDAERKQKVIELLETVSLSAEHFNRYPHEFSGGQRQRICIARALALDPKFIICDESVSALDVSVQAQVLNLLIDLRKKRGFTCIFISHDLSVVKFISDRMVVMNKGKIEEIGTADDIYAHPQKDYTKRLIDAIPKGI